MELAGTADQYLLSRLVEEWKGNRSHAIGDKKIVSFTQPQL